jgi:hypothetical protein
MVYSRIARRHALQLINTWAQSHQFTVVSLRQPLIVPFWKFGKGFQWFRIALQDASETPRRCWFRSRDFAVTPAPGFFQVIWDQKS